MPSPPRSSDEHDRPTGEQIRKHIADDVVASRWVSSRTRAMGLCEKMARGRQGSVGRRGGERERNVSPLSNRRALNAVAEDPPGRRGTVRTDMVIRRFEHRPLQLVGPGHPQSVRLSDGLVFRLRDGSLSERTAPTEMRAAGNTSWKRKRKCQ